MNLWLRLLLYVLCAFRRPRLTMPGGTSVVRFRVWPHDLDTSLHLNNGRYLSMMDLGRLDVMVASGLWRAVLAHKWTPIACYISIRYRRELRLFQGFRIETRILFWDAASVVMEQVFRFEGGRHDGQIAARALFKGGLYDRAQRRFVGIDRLMTEIGVDAQSPPMTEEITQFLAAERAMRDGGQDTV